MHSDAISRDLAAIARISAVPTILRTISESTGLRFTLVARVLPDRWIARAIHDELDFGLKVGGELDVATTPCRQVRDTREPIVIDQASTDPTYRSHPTPKMYGFESYIAVPIFRRNGEYSRHRLRARSPAEAAPRRQDPGDAPPVRGAHLAPARSRRAPPEQPCRARRSARGGQAARAIHRRPRSRREEPACPRSRPAPRSCWVAPIRTRTGACSIAFAAARGASARWWTI